MFAEVGTVLNYQPIANFCPQQKTLTNKIKTSGIAVHSGKKVNLEITLAPLNTGIVFIRADLPEAKAMIPARWDLVVDTKMCTSLANAEGSSISTVEHVMAALMGLGITNAYVKVDGPEMPIMDGSAAEFCYLINQAGISKQSQSFPVIKILKNVRVETENSWVMLSPSSTFMLSVEFNFRGRLQTTQKCFFDWSKDDFQEKIAFARTFGLYEDGQRLRSMGLAQGASLDNTIVINGNEVMNEEGLRFEDELVCHKVLDVIGDLYLSGGFIQGHFQGHNTNHTLNNQLLRSLFSQRDAYCIS